jgi:hypothetical protein
MTHHHSRAPGNANSKRKPQIDKFREAARELETDESEENFDRALKRIAVVPPKREDEAKKKGDLTLRNMRK